MNIFPAPYSPLRDGGLESQVLQRVVLGVHGEVVDRGRVRQVLGHRPRDQHAVPLEAQVVVQPAGVVLLDDESIVLASFGFRLRHRLRRFRRIAHAAVRRQPVRLGHCVVEPLQQVPVLRDALEHFVEAQMPQLGIFDLVPGARRGDGRVLTPAQ